MLITDEYRELNKKLHKDNEAYGTSGAKYAQKVFNLCMQNKLVEILDYGSGKGTLAKALKDTNLRVYEYDPCIEGMDQDPAPRELLVCTDVMEHIEPECIDNILEHMASKTKHGAFVSIATVPAKKILADGRNAHILLRSIDWWVSKFCMHFDILLFEQEGGSAGHYLFYLKQKEAANG